MQFLPRIIHSLEMGLKIKLYSNTTSFSSSLQLDMEVWSWTDCEMGYGVGMYWYGGKQTTSNRFPDEKEVLNVPPLPKGYTDILMDNN